MEEAAEHIWPHSPCPQNDTLSTLHEVLLEFDKLKQVVRQNPIASAPRKERTAEHSWHLAMSVILFARYASEALNVDKAVTLAIAHDIPEVFVGDTFVYSPAITKRHRNESDAMRKFQKEHKQIEEVLTVVEMWNEYESCSSAEGRFVMAMDVLLPIFLNYANISRSSWVNHGVTEHQVRERIGSVRAYCPQVADFASNIVDQAARKGVFRKPT